MACGPRGAGAQSYHDYGHLLGEQVDAHAPPRSVGRRARTSVPGLFCFNPHAASFVPGERGRARGTLGPNQLSNMPSEVLFLLSVPTS